MIFFPFISFFSAAQHIIKIVIFNVHIKLCGKNTLEMFEAVSMLSPADTKCAWFTISAKQYDQEASQASVWLSKLLAVPWFSSLACLSFMVMWVKALWRIGVEEAP